MRITQPSHFGNTPIVGNVTYKDAFVYIGSLVLGVLLFLTPMFRFNWLAIIGYIAVVSILTGRTPTGRSMANNLYGIVFKKPIKMVVSSEATINTLGHGVRTIEKEPDMDTYGVKLHDGNYALVYVVTSGINNWSGVEDYEKQALRVKKLFNVLEGGEGLEIVVKPDSDTGMMALKQMLEERENYEGDDFERMSLKRRRLLETAATSSIGRSIQQYAVLRVKPKNVRRCVKALRGTARLIRPAEYPVDVILAAMGLEGGLIDFSEIEKEVSNA